TVFGEPPYPFNYPTRRLTMEEMLAKIIDEGRREHEEMEIFIKEFRTTNDLLLEEACTETTNERCSAVLLNELPSKEKDPKNFTISCQVLGKHKEAEDFAADHLSRFESPHMEVLTERKIADKFSDEHLRVLKFKFKDDEPWYADFVNYIVGKIVPQIGLLKKEIGPIGGHHSANVTAKKVCEFGFYWPSVFKDANEYLNELAELRDGAYENTRIYKERIKKWHDSRLRGYKDFKVGDQVLLYNSRLKMYPGKLKSKWSGPNIVKTVYPHGAIEITDRDGFSFKVNGQRLKKYYGGNIDKEDDEVIEFENSVT
ncbi:hypothetical protein Tco_0517961, partial [Tanacetum coccineum]